MAKDNDGVIYDSLVPVCQDANAILSARKCRLRFCPKDFTRFHFIYEETLAQTGDEELAKELDNLWYRDQTMRRARPFMGAVLVAQITGLLGGEQYVITSRPAHLREATLASFAKDIPVIAPDRIRIRDQKDSRTGDEFKRDNVAEISPAAYFEDNTETFRYLLANQEEFPNTRLCLVDRPMNKKAPDLKSYRVYGQLGILVATMAARARNG